MPAAQGEPCYTGGGDDAGGHGQPEGVRGVVDIPPSRTALDPHGALLRVDADTPHGREVYYQPVVDEGQARTMVATAADGQEYVILASEVHGTDNIGHVCTAHYYVGALVDHGVVDLASFIVARITGPDELAAQTSPELFHGRFVEHAYRLLSHSGVISPPR